LAKTMSRGQERTSLKVLVSTVLENDGVKKSEDFLQKRGVLTSR
jgi:hypothetical protein